MRRKHVRDTFGILELTSRVKAVLRRSGRNTVPEKLELGQILLEPDRRRCTVNDKEIELTYKEYELLFAFLLNVGIVMKRDVLMERIWGIDFEGESRTLDSHIKSLRKKLGEEGYHIQTVRNVGYLAR